MSAYAETFTSFGPKTYVRKAGKPVAIVDTFTVLSPSEKYTLQVTNNRPDPSQMGDGDGDDDDEVGGVSRALILINGVQVIGPTTFSNSAILRRWVLLTRSPATRAAW